VAGTYDAELAAWPGLSSTILVNRAHLEDPNQIELLDMTPQTAEFTDAGLAIGQLYADASAGLSMWPISLTDAGADVLIQRDTDQLVVQIIPNQGGIPHRRHVRHHHASHHQRPPGSGRQLVDEFDLCGDTVCPGAHHDRGQWLDRDDRADPSRLGTGHVYIANGGGLGTEEDGSDDA
jgi:hypothetical protein